MLDQTTFIPHFLQGIWVWDSLISLSGVLARSFKIQNLCCYLQILYNIYNNNVRIGTQMITLKQPYKVERKIYMKKNGASLLDPEFTGLHSGSRLLFELKGISLDNRRN